MANRQIIHEQDALTEFIKRLNLRTLPITGFFGRFHLDADHCRKVFKNAQRSAQIDRRITPHHTA